MRTAIPTDTSLHRALGDERRAGIVRELEAAGKALDASELARRLGLHANTVRWHLGILAGAGLISSHPAPRQTPGRPRIVYELDRAAPRRREDEYRLLAVVLAETVSRTPGRALACEAAGRSWGRDLMRRPEAEPAGDEEATREVVSLLDGQGFEPSADGLEIEMRRCPFHDLAETHPQVVCAVHRGLVSGALEELGSTLGVDALEVFPRPGVCVLRLRRGPGPSVTLPQTGSVRAPMGERPR